MKVVINDTNIGLNLNIKAIKRYIELIGKECYFYKFTEDPFICADQFKYELVDNIEDASIIITKNLGKIINGLIPREFCFKYYSMNIDRTDPILIQVVEELGEEVNDCYHTSSITIKEIPDNVSWEILNIMQLGVQREIIALK